MQLHKDTYIQTKLKPIELELRQEGREEDNLHRKFQDQICNDVKLN